MRYVIIGNSAAGNAAAHAICARDPRGEVVIISDEPRPAYYRPLIPFLIDRERPEENLLRDELHIPRDVTVLLGRRAVGVDTASRSVHLDDGQEVRYDRLLLATGSSPTRPPVAGLDGPGVFFLRKWDDAVAIRQAAVGARRAVIIGGGRIGTKCALALRHLGLEVAVVEMLDRIVPLQFDAVAGEILGRALRAAGLELVLGQVGKEVVRQNGRVQAVVLDDGRRLEAELVVVTVGVRPNVELARRAGIRVNRGVLVDRHLRTSTADVYAAGDVVETTDRVTGESIVSGTWTNAAEMGRIAGENMAGAAAEYEGAFAVINALELAGIPVISVGLLEPPVGDGYRVFATRRGDTYRKLVVRDGVLVGALFVGDIEGAGIYTGLIKRKADVGPLLETLTARRPSYAPWLRRKTPELDAYQRL